MSLDDDLTSMLLGDDYDSDDVRRVCKFRNSVIFICAFVGDASRRCVFAFDISGEFSSQTFP